MSKEMNMSDQAVGAVMMALQKSLMEQSDIVPVLKGFKFKLSDHGLAVTNPPIVKFNEEAQRNFQESLDFEETCEPKATKP
tara:strand:+ start:277 stop:519 length:243 start_codon:yes stop_codon:yes gene_type:complete